MDKKERFLDLDILRGLAFLLMIIHHTWFFYNLSTHNYFINEPEYINIIGKLSRYTFILLSGFMISVSKSKNWCKRIFRSIRILIHGLVITYFSLIFIPETPIYFGILHYIAVSSLLLYFINPAILILLYLYFKQYPLSISILNTSQLDYFSLLKWLPISIIGMLMGYLYEGSNLFNNQNSVILFFETLSQNSLELYSLHFLLFMFISSLFIK